MANAAQYIERNHFDLTETMNYLYDMNANNASTYEIIGSDYQGFLIEKDAAGTYYTVDYSNKDYKELHMIFDTAGQEFLGKTGFAPEFTDAHSAVKSFGIYVTVPVTQEDGTVAYDTLISISKSKDFSSMIQLDGVYSGISSVMLDELGNYIISNDVYKSDNFFQYLYIYNDLTLDQKTEIINEVTNSEEGTLFYKNAINQDCVFVYRKLEGGNWYMVTCLSLDEFQQNAFDYRFTVIAVLILLLMFALDMIWMYIMNHRLKESMILERKANNAKSDFLARMSHDIRTPLNAVIGFSDLASNEENLSETVSDNLAKINSSGRYLLSLINDILDMSKIESNKFELHEALVNGPEFLNDIADVFAAQAKQKEIHFNVDFSESQTPWVYMDSLRSRQIYSNLLNNAIKFSKPGTTITWKITDTKIAADKIRMVSVITDQGCGMSKEFMQHIFHPFEQEQNSHSEKEGGTGLGLSIVKSLVEMMNGTIEVESELGKGSKFTITLERRIGDKAEPYEDEKVKHEKDECLNGKQVLLCEDHPLNQEIAVRLLEKKGMKVDCASNGNEGLKKFNESGIGYYDVILMDIRMPVMNGIEATKAIRILDRADAQKIPIIAMTANAFDDDVQNCLNVGMNSHIAKPVEPANLYRTLTENI